MLERTRELIKANADLNVQILNWSNLLLLQVMTSITPEKDPGIY